MKATIQIVLQDAIKIDGKTFPVAGTSTMNLEGTLSRETVLEMFKAAMVTDIIGALTTTVDQLTANEKKVIEEYEKVKQEEAAAKAEKARKEEEEKAKKQAAEKATK